MQCGGVSTTAPMTYTSSSGHKPIFMRRVVAVAASSLLVVALALFTVQQPTVASSKLWSDILDTKRVLNITLETEIWSFKDGDQLVPAKSSARDAPNPRI